MSREGTVRNIPKLWSVIKKALSLIVYRAVFQAIRYLVYQ